MTRSHGAPAEDAFDALFLAEWSNVVRIAHRVLGVGAQAEDVAQEAFLSFHRRFAAEFPERPGPWLYAAATHLALNALRAQHRRERRELASGREPARAAADPAGVVLAREAEQELRQALGRLRPKSAAILALRYSGLRYQEIAEALAIPVGQIGTRLRRAEVALRKEISNGTPKGR